MLACTFVAYSHHPHSERPGLEGAWGCGQAGRRLSATDLAALYALDAQLKPYVAKLRASMVHPSNKRRHVDPGAAARPPPGSQPPAYAPMDVDAAAAASPATTLGAPTPPVVATPPPAVKVRRRRRCQAGARSVELGHCSTAAHWQ